MQASGSDDGPITSINVTPLVDVCLVLVIIFMVIAPFAMQAGIKAAQSKAGAAIGKTSSAKNVDVELTTAGVKVNNQTIPWETLGVALRQAIAHSKDQLVSLSAAPDVEVGCVVEVLDLSKQMGAKKLAILKK